MNKGLEALKRLKWGLDITQEERIGLCECVEQELKALEVIRNKPWLVGEIVESKGDYKAYKSWCSIFRADMKYRATEEEYNLLKEVLL